MFSFLREFLLEKRILCFFLSKKKNEQEKEKNVVWLSKEMRWSWLNHIISYTKIGMFLLVHFCNGIWLFSLFTHFYSWEKNRKWNSFIWQEESEVTEGRVEKKMSRKWFTVVKSENPFVYVTHTQNFKKRFYNNRVFIFEKLRKDKFREKCNMTPKMPSWIL